MDDVQSGCQHTNRKRKYHTQDTTVDVIKGLQLKTYEDIDELALPETLESTIGRSPGLSRGMERHQKEKTDPGQGGEKFVAFHLCSHREGKIEYT